MSRLPPTPSDRDGPIVYDDHCRSCHKLGDLLCCETCPATYHLECVNPPLKEVPDHDWQCEICRKHQVGDRAAAGMVFYVAVLLAFTQWRQIAGAGHLRKCPPVKNYGGQKGQNDPFGQNDKMMTK